MGRLSPFLALLAAIPTCQSFGLASGVGLPGLRVTAKLDGVMPCSIMMSSQPAGGKSLGDKKLLVLGATGFVGSEVARQAVSKGYKVVGLSRRGGDSEAAKTELGKKIDWRKGDISKEGVIAEVLAEGGFAGIVHAVGILLEGDANKSVHRGITLVKRA